MKTLAVMLAVLLAIDFGLARGTYTSAALAYTRAQLGHAGARSPTRRGGSCSGGGRAGTVVCGGGWWAECGLAGFR